MGNLESMEARPSGFSSKTANTTEPTSLIWEDDRNETYSERDLKHDSRRSTESQHLNAPSLRRNLMRECKEKDPLFYYEVIAVLGVGSMGSVSKVRKRDHVVGGSARQELQRKQNDGLCMKVPVVGSIINFCSERSVSLSQRSVDSFGLQTFDDDDDGDSSGSSSLRRKGQYEVYYALKSIHLNRVTDETFIMELKNEIEILKTLDHPHIVKPIETYEHRNQVFMAMELCSGGDLYSRDPYTEEQAARIVNSILSAVSYMHEHNIVHRDLKYENILFVNDSPESTVKLIDFGLSKRYLPANPALSEGVGTIYTMAPEVLQGNYTSQADLWSIGVITYMLLSSQMPFYGRKRRYIVDLIMKCKYNFNGRRWKHVSPQAKQFVMDLLVANPDERATADQAASCNWLNRRFGATIRGPHVEEIVSVQHSLKAFADYSKLKKLALAVIAHKSTSDEIGILRKVFQQYDTKGKGMIGFEQFKEALSQKGHNDEELETMFQAVDLDGSGKIRYTEFLAATIEARGAIGEERLAEAFDRLDSDDSGYISSENLRELLGSEFPESEIDGILRECACSQDGRVSYHEFLSLWEVQTEDKRDQMLTELRDIETHESSLSALSSYDSGFTSSQNSRTSSSDSPDEQGLNEAEEEKKESTAARAKFIEEKHLSERRKKNSNVKVKFVAKSATEGSPYGKPLTA